MASDGSDSLRAEANQSGSALKTITEQGMGLSGMHGLWVCVRKRTQIDATELAAHDHCPVMKEPGWYPEITAFLRGARS